MVTKFAQLHAAFGVADGRHVRVAKSALPPRNSSFEFQGRFRACGVPVGRTGKQSNHCWSNRCGLKVALPPRNSSFEFKVGFHACGGAGGLPEITKHSGPIEPLPPQFEALNSCLPPRNFEL